MSLEVQISDNDLFDQNEDLEDTCLFAIGIIRIPPRGRNSYSYDTVYKREHTEGDITNLLRSFKALGLRRRSHPICIYTPRSNIKRAADVQGNVPRNGHPSLTLVIEFWDPSLVTVFDGELRCIGVLQWYQLYKLLDAWWYARVYIQEELLSSNNIALFNARASNSEYVRTVMAVADVWSLATQHKKNTTVSEDTRKQLIKTTFASHAQALRCFQDDEWQERVQIMFRLPGLGWGRVKTFNAILSWFDSQVADILLVHMGWTADLLLSDETYAFKRDNGVQLFVPAMRDAPILAGFTQAFINYEAALNNLFRGAVFSVEFCNSLPRRVQHMYRKEVVRVLQAIFSHDASLPEPKFSARQHEFSKPFIEKVRSYLANHPGAIILTHPVLTPLLRMYLNFNELWDEFGRWRITHYPKVRAGMGTHFGVGRAPSWVKLWAKALSTHPAEYLQARLLLVTTFNVAQGYARLITMQRALRFVRSQRPLCEDDNIPIPLQTKQDWKVFVRYFRWRLPRWEAPYNREEEPTRPPLFTDLQPMLRCALTIINPRGADNAGQATRVARWLRVVLTSMCQAEQYFPDLLHSHDWWLTRKYYMDNNMEGEKPTDRCFFHLFNAGEELVVPEDFMETNQDDAHTRARLAHRDAIAEDDDTKLSLGGQVVELSDTLVRYGRETVDGWMEDFTTYLLPLVDDDEDHPPAEVVMRSAMRRVISWKVARLYQDDILEPELDVDVTPGPTIFQMPLPDLDDNEFDFSEWLEVQLRRQGHVEEEQGLDVEM